MASPYDIAWAAGLFEGEGTFCIYKIKNRPDSYRSICSMASTDEDVIQRFHNIVGFGSFLGPYKHSHKGKERWVWQVQNYKECKQVAELFLPYLGERRRDKAEEMISIINGRHLLHERV